MRSSFSNFSYSSNVREDNDYYATSPVAVEELLKVFTPHHKIWECAAGEKYLSNVFEEAGYEVRSSDIIDRTGDIEIMDFLQCADKWDGDIWTNPPFKLSEEFIKKD